MSEQKKEPPTGEVGGGVTVSVNGEVSALLHSTTGAEGVGVPACRETAGAPRNARRVNAEWGRVERECQDVIERRANAAEVDAARVAFIMGLAEWKVFATLTLSDAIVGAGRLTPEQLMWKYRYLWRCMNADLHSKRYVQRVGHGYCAYAVAIEPHMKGRNQIHAHALFDRPVNFRLMHEIWNGIAGYAWIRAVGNMKQDVEYVCKYVSKGGELYHYKPTVYKEPSFRPMWYMDAQHIPLTDGPYHK